MTTTAKPGAILKALRLQKGWKLADVATKTGFPVSTLSKIENDKVALTYDKIARISKGMDVDIGVFFAEDGPAQTLALATGRRSIIRKGEGRVIETDTYHHRFVATELLNKRFVPMFGESYVRSIDKFGEMIRHSGEEFTYVIEGSLELHTELYAPVRLEAGDSIYFDSGMAHAYIDVGNTPCRVLTICSGDESQVMTAHEKSPSPSPAPVDHKVSAKAPVKQTRGRRAARN
ncbi:MAG: XRE family transcriptional regulator [Rhodospirillaceae bacterium]|nr:XRE family transcriptional regulator [Rhodospirillaceae bacterium]